jgi:sugar/nucleoside kinase (ribokinase family)
MKHNRVIILGDANVDLVIRLPDRSGGTLDMSGSVPQLHGGGSAANVAVAVARLNQEVTFVGGIGNDGYGRWVTDELAGEKVDVTGLYPLDDRFTPMVLALIEPSGERMVVVWPPEDGAHHFLPSKAIHAAFFQGVSWLHTSGMCLRKSPVRETILHAMELATAKGIPVSLDLNVRNEMWGFDDEARATFERAVSLSDVVFGNAEEEICLVARNSSIDQALVTLSAGNRTVIARTGAEGAYVSTSSQITHVPGFEVDVVDTLGAGDAFDGGFITARMEGQAVTESVRWGNAVAALKIGRSSGRGTPRRHELITFLNS